MCVCVCVKLLFRDINPGPHPPHLTRTSTYGSYHYFIILIIIRL